jgi:hypothetical protein
MNIKNQKEYGDYDFSNHELVITKTDNVEIYELLLKEDGKYRYLHRVGFSYVKSTLDYTLSCFGDYGNYVFGQALNINDPDIYLPYFLEKLRHKTKQKLEGGFSQDYLIEEIDEIYNYRKENGYKDEEYDEIIEDLKSIDNEYELHSYIYNMSSDEREDLFGETNYPTGKDLDLQVMVIFKAFKEIANRLQKQEVEGE